MSVIAQVPHSDRAGYYAEAEREAMVFAASRITSRTASGCDNIGTWSLSSSVVVAPIRFAIARSRSGCTVWSCFPTMYQLEFDFQAVPPAGFRFARTPRLIPVTVRLAYQHNPAER